MSLTKDIYLAFGAKVDAFAAGQSPAVPVEYVGSPVAFEPPDQGSWLEVRTFFNGSENYAWGAGLGSAVEQGFFRVGVVTRSAGIPAAQALAEEVATEFAKLTELGTALVYQAPQISGPLQEDDRLTVPVSIFWRAGR